jgi:predicted Zn-dependent protease
MIAPVNAKTPLQTVLHDAGAALPRAAWRAPVAALWLASPFALAQTFTSAPAHRPSIRRPSRPAWTQLAVPPAPNLPNLGDTSREDLSPAMERKIGEEIMRGIRGDRDYLDDAPCWNT